MKNIEFQLLNKKGCLRWKNWKIFVDNEKSFLNKKENNVCILFVCCNSFKAFSDCLTYLNKESNQNFDILVVDNSTNDENIKLFYDMGIKNSKVSILKPIDNIGGSGGFSLGMEYVIYQNYEYLILFEDDIIPIDKDIISNTINISSKSSLIFNKNSVLGFSLPFHLNCYPIQFLKDYGVVDPRFFLTYDDVDFSLRINNALKSGKYKKISTQKCYYHPVIKKNNQKCWTIYLQNRNSLLKSINDSLFAIIKEFILGFSWLFYGFSKGFIEGCWSIFQSYCMGVLDFLVGNIGFAKTNLRLEKLFKLKIPLPEKLVYKTIMKSEIDKITRDKLDLYGKLGGKNSLGIRCSNRIIDGIINGLVVTGFLNTLYPFFILSKNTVFIDSYDFFKEEYEISYLKSSFSYFHIFSILLSLILAICLFIPIYFLAFVKIIIKKLDNLFL